MNDPQFEYDTIKQNHLKGRYITYDHIKAITASFPRSFRVEILGHSVDQIPIEAITIGNGPRRILMWSQMHGNESTTTKAVFDLFSLLQTNTKLANLILENCTIKVLPMLNPDGAKVYTRVNANQIDLNRDAQERSQPESRVLHECFNEFEPEYCFNLHDQRTIFNVGKTQKPATVSFLAPAHDEERSISDSRAISMQLIVAMNRKLQQLICGQIGRYDDSFNPNCVGDAFQMQKVPTILFESGHFEDDYQREHTREYVFTALCEALKVISEKRINDYKEEDYFEIPENGKLFYDILIKNAHMLSSNRYNEGEQLGVLYKEVLNNDKIEFIPKIDNVGNLEGCYGYIEWDCAISNDLDKVESIGFSKEID